MNNELEAVIPIERLLQDECEVTCAGTEADVRTVKEAMLDEETVVGVSDIFKALGDPTRLRIIYALMQRELCVHDLTVVLGMGQSAISHQLRVLRNLRVVKRRKAGKTVFYSLDDVHIEQMIAQTLHHVRHL